MSTGQLLPRTPRQFPDESPLGFILRVSQRNGYSTPWHLAEFAGIKPGRLASSGLDMRAIAAALGQSVGDVRGYSTAGQDGAQYPALLGQRVGTRALRLAKPCLCTACVEELGYVPAWMDLAIVDACPRHRRRLISRCGACQTGLTWFRPGLLKCRCGANLTADPAVDDGLGLTDEHLDLLAHFVGSLGAPSGRGAGTLPTDLLRHLPLRDVLGLCERLARVGKLVHGSAWPSSVAAGAGVLLAQWPTRLYEALLSFGERRLRESDDIGFRRQFRPVLQILAGREGAGVGVPFVRLALAEFAAHHWSHAQIDARLELALGAQIGAGVMSLRISAQRRRPFQAIVDGISG